MCARPVVTFQDDLSNPPSPDIVGLSTGSATRLPHHCVWSSPATTASERLWAVSCRGRYSACAGGACVTGIRRSLYRFLRRFRAINSLLIVKAPWKRAARAVGAGAQDRSPGVTMVRIVSVHSRSCGDRAGSCVVSHVRSLCLRWGMMQMALGVRVRRYRGDRCGDGTLWHRCRPGGLVAAAAPHVARRVCGHGGVGYRLPSWERFCARLRRCTVRRPMKCRWAS